MNFAYREAILFTSNVGGGSYDIWLYQPLTGQTIKLTQDLGEEYTIPYWSPDVRNIAFIGKKNIVYVFNVNSRAWALIDQIDHYTLLSWSPDSLYLSYVKNGQIVIYNINTHASGSIVQEGATDVQWFPSGEALLFAAPDEAGNTQLYKIN
jgi:TolB protein